MNNLIKKTNLNHRAVIKQLNMLKKRIDSHVKRTGLKEADVLKLKTESAALSFAVKELQMTKIFGGATALVAEAKKRVTGEELF